MSDPAAQLVPDVGQLTRERVCVARTTLQFAVARVSSLAHPKKRLPHVRESAHRENTVNTPRPCSFLRVLYRRHAQIAVNGI